MEEKKSVLDAALAELEQKKLPVVPVRELKSGKEARVYVVQGVADGSLYALKVYHDFRTRSFQTQKHYMEDRFIGDGANIKRAIRKRNEVGMQFVQDTWIMREHYFLKKISEQMHVIPKLIKTIRNGVVMEYIGDENGPAPRLSEITIPQMYMDETYNTIIDAIELFLANGIIHADLSPFNMLWWQNKPYVIDFPQAVDVRESKRVYSLLKRDVKNALQPFAMSDIEVEEITTYLLDKYALPTYDL